MSNSYSNLLTSVFAFYGSEDEHRKDKGDGCRQTPNQREQCVDRKCILAKTLQHQGKEPGQRDTSKNHSRLGGIRQTPVSLQNQPCHQLPEETGVQLLCAARYVIWCRDMETHQLSTEQLCGRTIQNGKKYAQHHIQGQKVQHLGQGEDKKVIYIQQYTGQGTSTTPKTTGGPRVSPGGYHKKKGRQ